MKISVVLSGRNDEYGKRYLVRIGKSIESIHRSLKGVEYEIILVDYNQVKGKEPLSYYFKNDKIKHEVISQEEHFDFIRKQIEKGLKLSWINGDKYDLNDLYSVPFFGGPAFNIGFNASCGEYVLHTCADNIFKEGLGKIVENISCGYLYRSRRKHMSINDLGEFENIVSGLSYRTSKKMKKIDKKKRSIFKCAGDFILADRDVWKAVGGYYPLAHRRLYHIDNRILFRGLILGYKIYSLDYYIVNIHDPVPKFIKNMGLNLNYEISYNGRSYNHFEEMTKKEWIRYVNWSTHKILEPDREYHISINYKKEIDEFRKLFKETSIEKFYIEQK